MIDKSEHVSKYVFWEWGVKVIVPLRVVYSTLLVLITSYMHH